jgi:hypothetical protein
VSVDTKGRAGSVAKHVVVSSNDPSSPDVALTVRMDIVQQPVPAEIR